MARKLITERDVVEEVRKGANVILLDEGTLITPSARDAALQHGIRFTQGNESGSKGTSVTPTFIPPGDQKLSHTGKIIALGSDHGGFRLKETLKQYLLGTGYSVIDVGSTSEEACDYPDFAYAVASLVSSGQAAYGIMIDGVGVASSIVANKVPGIRAVPCYDEFVARSSREHNNANLLTLGGRIVGSELAKSITKIWLETAYAGGRHDGRVRKIQDIEQRFSNKR